jgi:hypothetical protein
MIDIVVRLIAAWLANATHGVNALAANLPRTKIGGGSDPAPPAVTIYNDADDAHAALNVMSIEKVPALVVWADSHSDRPLKGYALAKDVVIGIGFITDDQVDPVAMNRACGYIMRAAVISLARFNVQSIAGTARDLNGVSILQIAQIEEQRVTAMQQNRRLWGFLLPHVSAADTYASTMLGVPQL